MPQQLTRKELLELQLKAISLPFIIISVYEYGRKWTAKDYEELSRLIQAELETLSLEVNI